MNSRSSSLGGSGFGIGNSGDWGGIGSSTGSDAFGALGSSSSAIKPPPGLGNTAAEVRKSPPGFGVKPPPGFAKSSDAASLAPSPATSAPPSPAHAPSKADAKVKSFLAEAGLSKYIEFFIENEIVSISIYLECYSTFMSFFSFLNRIAFFLRLRLLSCLFSS